MTLPGASEIAIDFARSSFKWKLDQPDSIGRFAIDAALTLRGAHGDLETFYLGAQVLAGDVYGTGDLFKQPAYEFAAAFSKTRFRIFRSAHGGSETDSCGAIAERFVGVEFDIRTAQCRRLDCSAAALQQTQPIAAKVRTVLAGVPVELEFPVRHINIDASRGLFQIETGPLLALAEGVLQNPDQVAASLRRAYAIFSNPKRIELLLDEASSGRSRWASRVQRDCEIELLRLE